MRQRKRVIIDGNGNRIEVEAGKSREVRKRLAEKTQKRPSSAGFAKILIVIFAISVVAFYTAAAVTGLHILFNRAGTVGPVIPFIGFAAMLLLLASGAGLIIIALTSGIGFIVDLLS